MRRFDAVIFDMDGTLIEPLLDFRALRDELGVRPDAGILEDIASMPPAQAEAAHRKLLERELSAAAKANLMPGAAETISAVRLAGMKTALLTRNAAPAMQRVLERFGELRFDLAWSREDGPIKPEPDGILRACATLGVRPERTACVGDFHFDLIAARAAGAVSVLLATGERPAFADEADHVIRRLRELPALLGIAPPDGEKSPRQGSKTPRPDGEK
ncbi:MAG TPA: HAD family hydrolase [Phycisphaerae bacterium]|nr:HAD family hydrolase [Phycisphaerae bacterium]